MRDSVRVGFSLVVGLLFLVVYAFTRLYQIDALPIFTDEAIYIRWAQIGAQDANWRFISLTDGKQPMFTWITMAMVRLLPTDPLIAGRLTSVLAGFGTLIGLLMVSWELFKSKRVSMFVGILYLISPFALWYDRIAIYDSLVSTFSVWCLYLAIRLVRTPRLDIAMLLGMVMGAGMLNKSSGFLSLYMLPTTLVLFDWSKKDRWVRLVRFVGLVGVSFVLSQAMYSILRLSPFFYIVGQKDNVFVFSIGEWLSQPFRFFVGNLRGMFDWVRSYMTITVFVTVLIPLFTRWGNWRQRIVLYLWFLGPFVLLANFGKVLYPRFVLFMTMPLLIVAAEAAVQLLDRTHRSLVRVSLILLLIIPSIWTSFVIVTSPIDAPIPVSDRVQFMDDWPSGYGVPQVVAFLERESQKGPIQVFTEGTFGLFPYALEIAFVNNKNITVTGIWPLPQMFPESFAASVGAKPTYFVMNETQSAPVGWPLELVGTYQKGKRADRHMRLFKVHQPKSNLQL